MKFSRKIRNYEICLDRPESLRWGKVIENDLPAARKVVRDIKNDIEDNTPWYAPPFLLRLAKAGLKQIYQMYGGLYLEEMEAWAEALGIETREFLAYQCAYELSHLCSAGIIQTRTHGMLHLRTLDWPLKSIGAATRIFNFTGGDHEFSSIGIVGMVGALSGMVPGKYSVTINYAPTDARPSVSKMGPLFHLRDTLEECSEYEDAVRMLAKTPLSTNVFYTVCGARNGQGCIVERTQDSYSIRKFKRPCLVQTNHFNKNFKDLNQELDGKFLKDSIDRFNELADDYLPKAREMDKLASYMKLLGGESVENSVTQQKMVFCPKTGEVYVERRER